MQYVTATNCISTPLPLLVLDKYEYHVGNPIHLNGAHRFHLYNHRSHHEFLVTARTECFFRLHRLTQSHQFFSSKRALENAWIISLTVCGRNALRTSGRLMVIFAIPSSRFVETDISITFTVINPLTGAYKTSSFGFCIVLSFNKCKKSAVIIAEVFTSGRKITV